jgi:hypothetical protein
VKRVCLLGSLPPHRRAHGLGACVSGGGEGADLEIWGTNGGGGAGDEGQRRDRSTFMLDNPGPGSLAANSRQGWAGW